MTYISTGQRKTLLISPWVAMSMIQKSIRRGESEFALMAAATLLRLDPVKLQRRLRCIAFEDIGLADLELCQRIVERLAGSSGKLDWDTISPLVELMVRAPKCRAADDLLMGSDILPALAVVRRVTRLATDSELQALIVEGETIHQRAVALRNLLGTDRGPERIGQGRRGNPPLAFEALRAAGIPTSIRQLAWEAFRSTGSALAPMVALLSAELRDCSTEIKDDRLAATPAIGGVPLWSYDLYCREGRRALARFLDTHAATARWIKRNIAQTQQLDFLGALVFRVEGQRCRGRLRWARGDELRVAMDCDCYGPEALQLLATLSSELPLLHDVRLQCLS